MINILKKICNITSKGFYFLLSVISKGFFYYFYTFCSFIEKMFMNLKRFFKRLQRDPSASFVVIFVFLIGVFGYTYIYSSNNNSVKIKLNDSSDDSVIKEKKDNKSSSENSNEKNVLETNLFRIYGKKDINSIDFSELYKVNNEIVSWISVDSTNINYPIVKSDNNEFYLNHNINKSYDSNGWTFMDYRNNSDLSDSNTIFYGHNLINKTSFGSVSNMFTDKWFETSNHNIVVANKNGKYTYKIFSVYYSEPDSSYLQTNYDNKNEYLDFLNMLKEKSKFNFSEELNENDKIITLSTCTDDNKGRRVVHAKLIG